MKVKTNAGEVDLTSDMVRKGMVFEVDGERWSALTFDDHIGCWMSTDKTWVSAARLEDYPLLGCDPTIADCADVERYGIAPGFDAAEHGFAKLPEGGALDLSKPENVLRGMLFRFEISGEHRDVVAACDGNFGATMYARFLGCHPEMARREDCERFGIPERCEQFGEPNKPLDAAKYGFARLRDGGALDVRRSESIGYGMVFTNGVNERFIAGRVVRPLAWARADASGECDRADLTHWRLIGLDARYASHDDMDRLCCGARRPDRKDIDKRTGARCTLAIGDHDVHEDLATGTKWRIGPTLETATGKALDDIAKVFGVERGAAESDQNLRQQIHREVDQRMRAQRCCWMCGASQGQVHKDHCPILVGYLASRCNAHPVRGQVLKSRHDDSIRIATGEERCDNTDCEGRHTMSKDFNHFDWEQSPTFQLCAVCRERVMPFGNLGTICFSVYDHEAEKVHGGPVCETCFEKHKGDVTELRWNGERLVHETPAMQRRHHEAPLVALVNDAPEGLNADGWRAAVLAVEEHAKRNNLYDKIAVGVTAFGYYDVHKRLREHIRREASYTPFDDVERSVIDAACDAYQRAIAPRARRPHVKTRQGGGAAFKSKGLPLDMGDG